MLDYEEYRPLYHTRILQGIQGLFSMQCGHTPRRDTVRVSVPQPFDGTYHTCLAYYELFLSAAVNVLFTRT